MSDKTPANWPFPTYKGRPVPKSKRERKPAYPPGDPAPF